MTATEALEKIICLLRHDWYAPEILVILEDLENSARESGRDAGYDVGYQLGQEQSGRRSADR